MSHEISLNVWLNGPARKIGWMLVQSVWQGAAVAMVLALVLRLMDRRSSASRYMVCCIALAAIPVMSIVMFTSSPNSNLQLDFASSGPLMTSSSTAATAMVSAVTAPHRFDFQASLGYAASIWLLGVALLAVWHLCGWLNLLRWRRECTAVEGVWRDALDAMMKRMQVNKSIRLLASARLVTPAVVGIFRPMILVPIALAAQLTPTQAAAILAHELSHIRRHDYLVNLIETAIETLLFYHPAVWWISSQIRRERENCCDDLAAAMSDPIEYSRALLAAEGLRSVPLAMGLGAGSLRARIGRLINPHPQPRRGSLAALSLIFVTLACVAIPMRGSSAQNTTAPSPRLADPRMALWNGARQDPNVLADGGDRPETHYVRVVVDVNSITFQDQPTTLAKLPALLEAVDDRSNTVLQLAYATDEVTMGWFNRVEGQISNDEERRKLGFKYLDEIGLQPADSLGRHDASGAADQEFEPLPSLPQAPVSELTHIVAFTIGQTEFQGNDRITITEVRGTSDTIQPGGTYQVKGTYHLTSHAQASLALSVAAIRPQDARGFWAPNQSITVYRGDGEFTVYECIACPGYPHITFYAGGQSIGDV